MPQVKHDLSDFSHYDGLLRRIGNMQLKPAIRHYYKAMYYVQRLREMKWWLFALLLTLWAEFQIKALFPTSDAAQAHFCLIAAVAILAGVWIVEHCAGMYGGDPTNAFDTRDEEVAFVQDVENMIVESLPLPSDIPQQAAVASLFTTLNNNNNNSEEENKRHSTVLASAISNGATVKPHVMRPIARVETAPPPSPFAHQLRPIPVSYSSSFVRTKTK